VKKPNPGKRTQGTTYFILSFLLMGIMTVEISSPAHSSGEGVSKDEATQCIREAAHATDQAWEEFHAAAIGGTLASPLVQVTIESQLHEVRHLLMEARKAERSQDYLSVKKMTQHIQEITQNIIEASQERKQ
jgi:hypothetical protein